MAEARVPARDASAGLLRSSPLRLSLLFILVFVAAMSIALGAVYVWTVRTMDLSADAIIDSEIEGLAEQYQRGGLRELARIVDARSNGFGRSGAVYLLTDPALSPITGNLSHWPLKPETQGRWVQFDMAAIEQNVHTQHRVRAALFKLPSGHRLLVGTDISQQVQFQRRFLQATLWSIGVVAVLGVLIGLWHGRRMYKHVARLTEACRNIMSGGLVRRLPTSGRGDELDQLVQEVNRMLGRIAELTSTLRTTLDLTAHDLRSPLNRVRLIVDRAARSDAPGTKAALDEILTELESMDRTLSALLQIARVETNAGQLMDERIDVDRLVGELCELYEPLAASHGVSLRAYHSPLPSAQRGEGERASPARREGERVAGTTVRGNRELLARALANLIENAIKFTPGGGRIDVESAVSDGQAKITVRDSGPGIPAEDREHVLQPFARLQRDATQPGSGLGLTLVAAVVRLHHGELALEDNSPGLSVQVRLPMAGA